jgi:hypothetical protein
MCERYVTSSLILERPAVVLRFACSQAPRSRPAFTGDILGHNICARLKTIASGKSHRTLSRKFQLSSALECAGLFGGRTAGDLCRRGAVESGAANSSRGTPMYDELTAILAIR